MKLSLSIGRTINLGNYESARVDMSLESNFDSDVSNPTEVTDALYAELSVQLQRVIDAERKTKR